MEKDREPISYSVHCHIKEKIKCQDLEREGQISAESMREMWWNRSPKETLDNLKNRFWEHGKCERSITEKNRTIYGADHLYSEKVLVILLYLTDMYRS